MAGLPDSGDEEAAEKISVDSEMSVREVSAFLRRHVKLPDRFCEAFEGMADMHCAKHIATSWLPVYEAYFRAADVCN